MRLSLSFLLTLGVISSLVAADNWPQFRGPTGDGHASAKNLPIKWSETENIRWKTPIHDKGWSSPVVWGDQVWVTAVKEKYAGENLREDAQKKSPKPEWIEMYAVCLDKATGKVMHDILLRKQDKPDYCHSFNSYGTPTPVIEEGRAYFHFGSHGTFCVDTKTAAKLWERTDIQCDHWRGPGSSPIVYENLLVLTFDGHDKQFTMAIDKKDGKTVWHKEKKIAYTTTNGDLKKAYSTPSVFVVNGKPQLITPSAEATLALDPKTGDEYWRIHHGGMNAACKPVAGHGLIYLSSGHTANVLAVKEGGSGKLEPEWVAWKTLKAGPTRPSFLLVDNMLFTVSDNGFVGCLDAKTGQQYWQERLGGQYSSSPVLAEGRIYVSDQEGKTKVFAASKDGFELLATNTLTDGCMASPAVVGDAIYLRTKTHLYCIGKK